ncbi:hypothetical protein [Streptomyces sp. NBC_00439]|uniref:hypothetical protein n=1 Tax=Streptomyces sp. NBC_00439 TaxID=2903650 RepID=UPI002251F03A|nr:hypothetical protein [Streptomyces sp. NBC_00439]MCX5103438.1 hypothetical protein [Streptomyces sp. NBC_00439]
MRPLAIVMLHSALLGGVTAAAINGIWLVLTGHVASPMTTLVAAEAVCIVGAVTHAASERRQRMALEETYQMPAFEGDFKPPNRPPADENPEED